ncbi:MAG: protein kinase [Planctomycetota bacterium]
MSFEWSYGSASPEAPPPTPPSRPSATPGATPGSAPGSSAGPRGPAPEGRFGPFVLRGELGRGGMGAVYRAWDPVAEREVALKVVADTGRRERFRREGEITARLSHPGIVGVHSAGEAEGYLYLAYELVEGARELDQAFRERDVAGRVALVRDAARALGYAHERGVIHRDVKPSNILVDAQDRVRVADFGLAAAGDLQRLTQTGAFLGTPSYMSPEHIATGELGPPADVWALGVILYEALTGELPFNASTLLELGIQITSNDPAPPRARNPAAPASFEKVCLVALAREPGDRYPDAEALAQDLDLTLSGSAPSGASTIRGRGLARRSGQVLVGVGAALAVVATTGLGGWELRARLQARARANELARLYEEVEQLERAPGLGAIGERAAELRARLAAAAGDAPGQDAPGSDAPGQDAPAQDAPAQDAPAQGAASQEVAPLRARLGLLEALAALARGDLPAARTLAGRLPPGSDAARLCAAALHLEQTESPQGAALEDLALLPELQPAELRAWRLLARLRGGGPAPSRDELRRALVDLARREREAGEREPEALRPGERALQAWGYLALEDAPRARAALNALPRRQLTLEREVLLAEVAQALSSRDAKDALARVQARGAPTLEAQPESPRWARAAQLNRELLFRALEAVRGRERTPFGGRSALLQEREPFLVQLRLAGALHLLLSDAEVSRLMDVVFAGTLDLELGLALSDAAPHHAGLQLALARSATKLGDAAEMRRVLPQVERAVELAPTPEARRQATVYLIDVLTEMGEGRRVLELADALLPELSGIERAEVLDARSRVRQAAGRDIAGALADIEEATRLSYDSDKRTLRRAQLLRLLGRHAEAYPELLRYAATGPFSSKHEGAVGWLWSDYRGSAAEELEPVVRRFAEHDPGRGDWAARHAWLLLRLGRRDEAAARLEQALRSRGGASGLGRAGLDGMSPSGPARRAAAAALAALREGAPTEEALAQVELVIAQVDRDIGGYRELGPPPPEGTPR